MNPSTPSERFLQQRIASQGWAPIHDLAADFLEPGMLRFHLDFAAWQRQPEMIRQRFPRSAIYRARTEAFGEILVLSMSPMVLAERISMIIGGAVEIIADQPKKAPTVATQAPVTSDRLALAHVGVVTKAPPRACRQCGNLSGGGTCLVALRGELEGAPNDYRPDLAFPRRCLSYAPPRADRDEYLSRDGRSGRQLWPEVVALVEKRAEPEGAEQPGAMDRASEILAGMLKGGPRAASEILASAEGAGISSRTMQVAAERLGVVKAKAGFSSGWTWALPQPESASVE